MRGTALRNGTMKTAIFYNVSHIHQINVVDVNTKCSTSCLGKKYAKHLLKNHEGETIQETLSITAKKI